MKALFAVAMTILTFSLMMPAVADRDGYRQYSSRHDYRGDYDRRNYSRRNWTPPHNQRYRHYRPPSKYYGSAYPRYDAPYRGGGHITHKHYYNNDPLKVLGGIYLLNEILHHDQHRYYGR